MEKLKNNVEFLKVSCFLFLGNGILRLECKGGWCKTKDEDGVMSSGQPAIYQNPPFSVVVRTNKEVRVHFHRHRWSAATLCRCQLLLLKGYIWKIVFRNMNFLFPQNITIFFFSFSTFTSHDPHFRIDSGVSTSFHSLFGFDSIQT